MRIPPNWVNPIVALPGQLQHGVDPLRLLPSRSDLFRVRLDFQGALLDPGTRRHTEIEVTADGIIWDGHHAIRAAAERGINVTVKVVNVKESASAASIMDLNVG
jgi:hypothetical protein